MIKTYNCPCEEGKHRIDTNLEYWRKLATNIDISGENMEIAIKGKWYSIPRIYIAMHGLTSQHIERLEQFAIKK